LNDILHLNVATISLSNCQIDNIQFSATGGDADNTALLNTNKGNGYGYGYGYGYGFKIDARYLVSDKLTVTTKRCVNHS
jgi:iron complex outermembrane receptor protein